MMETMATIIGSLALLLGIPALILWIRDRSRRIGGVVTRFFGLFVLLCGIAMLVFILYNGVRSEKSLGEIGLRYLLWSIWPLVFIFFGWKWLNDMGPGIEDLKVDHDSSEMKASIEKAKATLPLFVGNVRKHVDGAYVKYPFHTDQDIIEHVWGYVHHFDDGIFNVSMVNQPTTQEGEYTERMDVSENDIEDWMILQPDGRMRGAYSRIAALEYLEHTGFRFNQTLKRQKAQLLDIVAPQRT